MERRIVNFTEPGVPVTDVSGTSASIFVFGPISSWWGANKNSVISALRGKSFTNINVYISSPGGELSEAFDMSELLRSTNATLTAYLMGTCASAATMIASTADRVVMSKTCVYMIHKPSFNYTGGNAEDLRKSADLLDLNEGIMLDVYAGKTGMDKKKLAKLLRAETWMAAEEALEMGFVDEIVDRIEIDWTAPLNGMPTPWDSWLYDNADSETSFTGEKAFTSTVINLIQTGFTQYQPDDSQKFTIMNFAKKVIDFLVGKGHISADQSTAAQESLSSLDMIEAVQASARAEFAQVTNEQVVAVLRNLTPEHRAELFPVAEAEPSSTESTDEGIDQVGQLRDQIAQLQEQLAELQQAQASANAKKPVALTGTNGKTSLAGTGASSAKINVEQLAMALKALDEKQLTAATFFSITGMNREEALAKIKG